MTSLDEEKADEDKDVDDEDLVCFDEIRLDKSWRCPHFPKFSQNNLFLEIGCIFCCMRIWDRLHKHAMYVGVDHVSTLQMDGASVTLYSIFWEVGGLSK